MNNDEFEIWLAKSGIPDEGKRVIKQIRGSQPVRSVAGGKSNVIGFFPSEKMSFTRQFESHTLELAIIKEYEFSDDVLEYYDQPGPIQIEYSGKSGRKVTTYTTPDFFVIRRNMTAGWEECKKTSELESFAQKSNRFTLEDGKWRSPSSEKYAERYGLYFQVRSSDEINWVWQRNIDYLSDYLQDSSPVCEPHIALVASALIGYKQGMFLSELLYHTQLFSPDDIYSLIARGEIYVDLNKYAIVEQERTRVYTDKLHSKMDSHSVLPAETTTSIIMDAGQTVIWDGTPFVIVNVAEKLWLKDGENPPVQLSRTEVENLVQQNKLTGTAQKASDSFVLNALMEASPADFLIANERLKKIAPYLENVALKEKKTRSERNWLQKYRKYERIYGYGYIGLLSKTKDRGNRSPKIPIRATELMAECVEALFKSNVQRNINAVYGDYCLRCEEEQIHPPSIKTFSKFIEFLNTPETVHARKGKRAAYQVGMFYWQLEKTTPRHGDRPFQIAHLDHTELDIELLQEKTFKNFGRPWLSLLIDAYSRRILAFSLSYEPPSYRSCMLIMKECVRRHNRLPQTIVVDNGSEFDSVYFENFLALYKLTKKTRPSAQPRFGSVVERMFGTTNTMFIHNLIGNTKIMKEYREVTKSVNPANNAIWTLKSLMERIEKFIFEIYDLREHPALGQSPREAFMAGMAIHGMRAIRMINYDDAFRFSVMPSTNKGSSKVIISRGIKIHNTYYWNDAFQAIAGEDVPVKYDPYDISTAYAYVRTGKIWVECKSEYAPILSGITEKELKVISTEIRRQKQLHQKRVSVSARDVAMFLRETMHIENSLLESKKAAEMRAAGIFGEDVMDNRQDKESVDSRQIAITTATEIYGELEI